VFVILASHTRKKCKCYFLRERCVYFNIREKRSVIQASIREWECNLLFFCLIKMVTVLMFYNIKYLFGEKKIKDESVTWN